jgi:hypothetical protein
MILLIAFPNCGPGVALPILSRCRPICHGTKSVVGLGEGGTLNLKPRHVFPVTRKTFGSSLLPTHTEFGCFCDQVAKSPLVTDKLFDLQLSNARSPAAWSVGVGSLACIDLTTGQKLAGRNSTLEHAVVLQSFITYTVPLESESCRAFLSVS